MALTPGLAAAGTSVIGRTWPIVEPDALTEIEARAATAPRQTASLYGPRAAWSAMKAAALDRTAANRTRFVVPFHTLDDDIRLPDGRVLYAKGYTFNPLSYVTLTPRLIVVAPGDLPWALDQATGSDFILLTGGKGKADDPITLGEKHHHPLFILEDRVKARLGLTVAPVIIHQVGQRLQLDEVRLDARKAGA
jgi:conjugal transfer pilus assembly protein TraW